MRFFSCACSFSLLTFFAGCLYISPCCTHIADLMHHLQLILSTYRYVAGNEDMEKLYLTECGLTADGAKAIANVLKETKLREV